MPKKSADTEIQPYTFDFRTISEYEDAVRKLLKARKIRDEWADQLIADESKFMQICFNNKAHPAEAALEIFITEEDSVREPEQPDLRLKLELGNKTRTHLKFLVSQGLWGESEEDAATRLIEQALAQKLEAGFLRATYPKQNV